MFKIALYNSKFKGAFVWDQSGIRIIGIMQVSVRLAALPIPEYLDFHSRSRIAGIYSRIYSYSRIFPNERALSLHSGLNAHQKLGIFLLLPGWDACPSQG